MFTLDERLWLCCLIRGNLIQPFSIEIKGNVKSIRVMCDRYKLRIERVKLWLKGFDKGTLREETEELWLNHRGWTGPPSTSFLPQESLLV